uniref:Orf122 n=1 Tax=Euonymus alatus TaxID=4307 RepID=A0A872PLZ1_EUOAL|nr:orf122 [Euonymus alatus]QOX10148.1 orf122 [Euonymus alatus]
MCLRRHASKLCTLRREKERCSQLLPQERRKPPPPLPYL